MPRPRLNPMDILFLCVHTLLWYMVIYLYIKRERKLTIDNKIKLQDHMVIKFRRMWSLLLCLSNYLMVLEWFMLATGTWNHGN